MNHLLYNTREKGLRAHSPITTCHRPPTVLGRRIGTVGKHRATPEGRLEVDVAGCENSRWLHLDVGIHRRYPSHSDRADRSEIAADPFGPDRSDRTRVTNHPRSWGLDVAVALARALLPAAAFAVAMRD